MSTLVQVVGEHQTQCPRCHLLTIKEWADQVDVKLGRMAEKGQGLSPPEQRKAIQEDWEEYLQFLRVPICECDGPQREMAHHYALEFLQPQVSRGDPIEKVSRYPSAHACGVFYTVQVGGKVYYKGKVHSIKPRQLVVKELAEKPCLYVFELSALFAEMNLALHRMPLRQLSWLEEDR